jgi:phosphomannomutase
VGEINVVEKLLAVNGAGGGEGNGGVIIPDIHPCRDSFGGMAVVLQLLAEEDKRLDEIVDSLPRTTIVKDKVACPSEAVFTVLKRIDAVFGAGAEKDRSDGLRLKWADRWLQVRASNTEPIVRVVAEARSEKEARALAASVLAEVKALVE